MAKKSKRKNTSAKNAKFKLKVLFFILFLLITLVLAVSAGRFTFVEKWAAFWEISLAIGLTAGVISAIICAIKNANVKKSERIVSSICVLLLTTLFVFCGVWGGLANINHYCDSGEVSRYYAEIEDKWRSRGRSTSYYFEVTARDESIDIQVSFSEYNNLDVGDSYVIEYHEGALGEPYYIAVGPVP